jgi:hypothetical protein
MIVCVVMKHHYLSSNKLLPGINAGFTATYGMGSHFSLQSGLSFSTKGGKITGKGPMGFDGQVYPTSPAVLKSSQMYLQLPVYALYSIKLSSGKGLIVSAGPYVAQGIGGNTTLSGSLVFGDFITNDDFKEKTFSSRGLKKFDYGVGGGVAFDLGECILGVNYEWGLKDNLYLPIIPCNCPKSMFSRIAASMLTAPASAGS